MEDMLTTMAGEKTHRFDQMAPEEALRRLDELTKENDDLKEQMKAVMDTLDKSDKALRESQNVVTAQNAQLFLQNATLNETRRFIDMILRLPLVRFLNLFCHWYTMENGEIVIDKRYISK